MSEIEWSTVLASAGISAVVGAVVSLISVSALTTRRAQAEARWSARREVEKHVQPLSMQARRYQAGRSRSLHREEDIHYGDDFVQAARVLHATEGLSLPRRLLVLRRCRKVFGGYNVRQALLTTVDEESTNWQWSSVISGLNTERDRKLWEKSRYGLLHNAYRQTPESMRVSRLRYHLWQLEKAR